MRRTCPKCGKKVDKDQEICHSCGALLSGLSGDTVPSARTSYTASPEEQRSSGKRRLRGPGSIKTVVKTVVAAFFLVVLVVVIVFAIRLHGTDGTRELNIVHENNSVVATLRSIEYWASPQSSSGVLVTVSFGTASPSIRAAVIQGQQRYASTYWSQAWESDDRPYYLVYFSHFDISGASQVDVTATMDNGKSADFVFDVPAK